MWPPIFLEAECSASPFTTAGSKEHIQLDRAASYIREHFADELSLDEMAKVAGFSKYHFHRMFTHHYGETVGDYVRRIRLEKAALKLLAGKGSSITRVAFDCGFSSSQHFAKSFKTHFGVSPIEVSGKLNWENVLLKKIQNMEIEYGQRHCLPAQVKSDGTFIHIPVQGESPDGCDDLQEVEVMIMPSYRVAYVRTSGETIMKTVGNTMDRLISWAACRGLFTGDSVLISAVGIIPDLSGLYTYDASVTVSENVVVREADNVQIQYLPGGQYAVYHGKFQTPSDLNQAWDRLTCGWWVSSYFPRDRRPCYKIFYNDPSIHPAGISFVDICLPVTTLCK